MNTRASNTPSPGNDRGDSRSPSPENWAFATTTFHARPCHVRVSCSTVNLDAFVFNTALGAANAVAQPAEFALVPPLAGNRIQEVNGHVETARYVGFGLGPLLVDSHEGLVEDSAHVEAVGGAGGVREALLTRDIKNLVGRAGRAGAGAAAPGAARAGRTLGVIDTSTMPRGERLWWLVVENRTTDLCRDDPGHEVTVIVDTTVRALTEAIERVPERLRMVLGLVYIEGLTYSEVGGLLKVSEPRVCQLHSEALKHLRREMGVGTEKAESRA